MSAEWYTIGEIKKIIQVDTPYACTWSHEDINYSLFKNISLQKYINHLAMHFTLYIRKGVIVLFLSTLHGQMIQIFFIHLHHDIKSLVQ